MWWLPARRFLHPASLSNSARLMSSSTSTHSSSTAGGALTPALLKSLTSFWLGDHPNGPLKEPMDMSRFKRWFSSSPENDRLCQERFGPAVEEASHKTDQQLLDLATGEDSPEAALGLALLLDQIPRNIYRGAEARKVRVHRGCLLFARPDLNVATDETFALCMLRPMKSVIQKLKPWSKR